MITSTHFEARARQRGIQSWVSETLYALADVDVPAGGGASILALSRAGAVRLIKQGVPTEVVERVQRVCLIISESGGACITAINGKRAARAIKRAKRHGH